jgi:hypothetical protein
LSRSKQFLAVPWSQSRKWHRWPTPSSPSGNPLPCQPSGRIMLHGFIKGAHGFLLTFMWSTAVLKAFSHVLFVDVCDNPGRMEWQLVLLLSCR